MSISAAFQEMLTASFESQMQGMYTSIPCVVVAVRDNLNGQMVDIQPSINQKMKDGTVAERTVILGIPVSFPVSKTAGFTFPINVGDTGLAVFSMRSMEAWKSGNGLPSTPTNSAKMDKSDAIFIPGIQPAGMAVNNPAKHVNSHNTKDAVMFNNLGTGAEVEVRLKQDGSVVINTTQKVEVNCKDAIVTASGDIDVTANNLTVDAANTTWIGSISHQGDYTGTGVQTFNGVIFSSHVHGTSPPPSNP